LGPPFLGFRVGTPPTSQRAAFHENRGADAWAVMYAETLDIEDGPFFRHGFVRI
jgi:hypothetical protein